MNTLSEYTYFYTPRNITSYTFVAFFWNRRKPSVYPWILKLRNNHQHFRHLKFSLLMVLSLLLTCFLSIFHINRTGRCVVLTTGNNVTWYPSILYTNRSGRSVVFSTENNNLDSKLTEIIQDPLHLLSSTLEVLDVLHYLCCW